MATVVEREMSVASQAVEQTQGGGEQVRRLIAQLGELGQSLLAAHELELGELHRQLKAAKAKAATRATNPTRSANPSKRRGWGRRASLLKATPSDATTPVASPRAREGKPALPVAREKMSCSLDIEQAKQPETVHEDGPQPQLPERKSDAWSDGSLALAPAFNAKRLRPSHAQRLRVQIISASGLRDADWMLGAGLSDPYCTCAIIGKPGHTITTPVINDSLAPVWNYTCVFLDFKPGDSLEFHVFDKDFGKTDDLLGRAVLTSSQIDSDGFQGTMLLCENGDDEAPTGCHRSPELKICVTWQEDPQSSVTQLRTQALAKWYDLAVRAPPKALAPPVNVKNQSSPLEAGTLKAALRTSCLQRLVVQPSALRGALWDGVALLTLVYEALTLPVMNGFDVEMSSGLMVVTTLIACFWTCDCLSTFFVGFHTEGILQMDIFHIGMRYLKSWFLLDVFILLIDWTWIVTWLMRFVGGASGTNLLRLVKIMRALRGLRLASLIVRAFKLADFLENTIDFSLREFSDTVCTLVEALLFVLISTHFIGCAWYILGSWHDEDTLSWVNVRDISDRSLVYRYATSYHWAITQFTPASMEVTPVNAAERVFTVIIDLIGLVGFSTFVSTITTRMTQLRSLNKARTAQLNTLRNFFFSNQISLEVRSQVLHWVRTMYKKTEMTPVTSLEGVTCLAGLPKCLAMQLNRERFLPIISHHPFMSQVSHLNSDSITDMCSSALTDQALFKGGMLFASGDRAEQMYFVASGEMSYQIAGREVKVKRGQWVSEATLWIEGWCHQGEFSAIVRSDVVGIAPDAFHAALGGDMAKSSQLSSLVGKYACRFIRDECDYDLPALFHCTDLWGDADHLAAIVRRCIEK